VHPKDLEQGKVNLIPIQKKIAEAEIVDCQYWRTLSQLLDAIPELKNKPVILTHHNEKNLLSYEWPDNIIHIAKTKESQRILSEKYPKGQIHYIPNSFDHELFHYNVEYPPKEKAVGYVGRIVPWKGLKEIAKACYELGYPLMMMGKRDKDTYMAEIPQEHQANMDFSFFNCEDEDRPEFYKNITVYVGNSGGGREVGTLGFIEALACGVPVVTTPTGLAADIGEDDKNMMIVDYDDYDGLKQAIQNVVESLSLQQRIRKEGWETIRNYNDERMAWQYREVYNSLLYKEPLVSVVIPATPERLDQVKEILKSIDEQDYPAVESIVVFDQALDPDQVVIEAKEALKRDYRHVVKVLATNSHVDYKLAMARNLGVVEADGAYIMLNDSRLCPEKGAIKELLKALNSYEGTRKAWVFGEKGGEKSTFVENFSMILRKNLITGGMFNERITAYGGMSQELRGRFSRQGFEFGYVPTAKAKQISKSSLSPAKREGIIKMKNLLYKLDLK
jgi:hypothetical protein